MTNSYHGECGLISRERLTHKSLGEKNSPMVEKISTKRKIFPYSGKNFYIWGKDLYLLQPNCTLVW